MRLGLIALAAALFGGACSAQISDGGASSLDGADAGNPGDPGNDATPLAACTSRTVYLNFDGQALTQGPSDATQNIAGWMNKPAGLAPRYLDADPNRLTAIQTIVDGVRAQLSQFPITVATTRPDPGNSYVMIVLGGQRDAVGSNYTGAVNKLDCGDQRPNDVAWISDGVNPPQHVINNVIGAIGFGLGLTATNDKKDCMCGWANGCLSDNNNPCTLGSPIQRDPNPDQPCIGAAAQQDEVAALHDAFCK